MRGTISGLPGKVSSVFGVGGDDDGVVVGVGGGVVSVVVVVVGRG